MRRNQISISPAGPYVGAMVTDIGLADSVTDHDFGQIRLALAARGAIFAGNP